jgi:hypothetical protein
MAENRFDETFRFQLRLLALFIIPSMLSCMILESTSKDVSIEFSNDPRVDRSFVSGQPCEAPCWYGLELGEASVEDIRTTLSSLPFIDSHSIGVQSFSSDPDELLIFANCVYSPNEDCILFETAPDGRLRKIILEIYYPLTLESAIERLGSPMYYILEPISGRDACRIFIHWPDKNVLAILEAAPREKHCNGEKTEKVNLGSQIDQLIYTDIEIQIIQQDGIPWIQDQ